MTVLLSSVGGAALAAPAGDDARLQAMQKQLDAMRSELNAIRGTAGPEPRLAAMQQQLDAIAAQLKEMRTAQAAVATDVVQLKQPPAASTVTATLPNGRPLFSSADGRFTAAIRTYVQLDAGKYFQSDSLPPSVAARDLNEGANFRRARVGLEGRLFSDFDYNLTLDFGGNGNEDPGRLYEASVTYTALKPMRIKVGAFEVNSNLASAVLTSQMPFFERPSPAHLGRALAAGNARVAAQITSAGVFGKDGGGFSTRWFVSGAVTGNQISTISSTGTATPQPFDEQLGLVGRAALGPYSGTAWQAHFGVNAQRVLQPSDAGGAAAVRYGLQLRDRPELRLDGARLVDTGLIDSRGATLVGLEAGLTSGPFLIEAEWSKVRFDRRLPANLSLPDPKFGGWYVQGVWVLTGENRPYNAQDARFEGPRPANNFSLSAGTWGAWELAARYSVTDLNYSAGNLGAPLLAGAVRGGEQTIATVGVNWILNPAVKLMLHYQHVDIDRLTAGGAQLGQDYDTVAARAQLAF